MWSTSGFVQIEDRRPTRPSGTYTFDDPLAGLYLACCDRPITAREAVETTGGRHSAEDVTRALDEFVARGLMFRDENLFVALAVPATRGSWTIPSPAVDVCYIANSGGTLITKG